MPKTRASGFTLVELLIVIAVTTILASVVFVAVDPAARFANARDDQRKADVASVLSALVAYQTDNDSALPAAADALADDAPTMIGTATSGCDASCDAVATSAACVDLTTLADEGYFGSVPVDSTNGTAMQTLYYLTKNANGTLTVGACAPESSTEISVTR